MEPHFFLSFVFILFSPPLLAEINAYQDCMQGTSAEICAVAGPQLNAQQKYNEAFAVTKRACSLNIEFCDSQLMYIAEKIGPKAQAEVSEFFKVKCDKEPVFCDDHARILEDQKKYAESIIAARKYFAVYNDGFLPYLAYKHGEKKEAFETSLAQCRKDSGNCTFYLRYMPDHPQQNELVALATVNCRGVVGSSGATSCAIAGTFHFKNKNMEAAHDLWQLDCDRGNMLSCKLIISGFRNQPEKLKPALPTICAPMGKIRYIPDVALQKAICAAGPLKSVPKLLQENSDVTLRGFLEEQK